MLRNFFIVLLLLALLAGCGDEGMVRPTLLKSSDDSHYRGTLQKPPETVATAPSLWTPDAITMDELIYPYAAKQCVGIHDIIGEAFRLASCEVLYKSRRVRHSERENRWVRLSTGQSPHHATQWTHDGVPQFLYIFLNFQDEDDYQRFGVGIHSDVLFTVVDAFSIGVNTWELKLMYQGLGVDRTSVGGTAESLPIVSNVLTNNVALTAGAPTGYFWSGGVRLNGITLTGIAYDTDGLTLRAAAGQRIEDGFPTPLRLVLTQRSAPTRENRFGRRIQFTHTDLDVSGRYAYIRHSDISAEQSKDLRQMGEDIQRGDIFHLYVYKQ